MTASRSMTMTRRFLHTLAVGVLTLLPVGVASAAPDVVRLADQTGAEVDYAAIWVAENQGYFKDENITIDRRLYANGPAGLLDYASGAIDAEMAAIVPFMQFAARGGDFKLVMSLTKGNVRPSSDQRNTSPTRI